MGDQYRRCVPRRTGYCAGQVTTANLPAVQGNGGSGLIIYHPARTY